MSVWTTDALVEGLASQIVLDSTIALFVRGLVALLLMIFLIVFFIELLVLNHMLTFGVLIGQVAIALRPVRSLRDVSGRMIRNLVTLSLTPALGVASLALSIGRLNEADEMSFGRALGALAGLVVSVLMPLVVAKFLPLGGQTGSTGRSLLAAGAQVAGTAAAGRRWSRSVGRIRRSEQFRQRRSGRPRCRRNSRRRTGDAAQWWRRVSTVGWRPFGTVGWWRVGGGFVTGGPAERRGGRGATGAGCGTA